MKLLANKYFIFGGTLIFFLFLSIFLFWPPLFDNVGALQWDAREVHLTNLIFSSSVWHQGFLPFWTPYIFSGFPQIADLQVAVFYPVNLLVGLFFVFNQKIIFWQLIFHYTLAGFGMFLLARHLAKSALAGVFAGIAYMLSGFMIGHASHLGMQNTAAWLPVVFFLSILAVERQNWRYAVWAGGVAGIMILAGHFQTAVFAFFALGLYLMFGFPKSKHKPFYQIALWAIIAVMAFLISAVQLLPTFELTKQSQRADISLELAQTESLNPQSLRSIITSNHQNVSEGDYSGPWDRTQNNLFLGKIIILFTLLNIILLWIPAYAGITARRFSFSLIILTMIASFYSLGSYGFLHRYFYLFPLFNKMRAPSNMMILFDFAVILLAALGLSFLKNKLPLKYFRIIGVAAIVLLVIELLPQAASSELLYARKNSADTFQKPWIVENTLNEYGQLPLINRFKLYRVPELDRNLAQVFRVYDFGGYNPLSLQRQAAYEDAMVKNPVLVDLAGIKYLPCQYIRSRENELKKVGNLCINDRYFPRAFLVDQYISATTGQDTLTFLNQLDPRSVAVLENFAPAFTENNKTLTGEVTMIENSNPNKAQFSVTSNKPALLVVGQSFYPGWQAVINGRAEKVLRADYLFQAVPVPEGHSTVTLTFAAPQSLKLGIFLSVIGLIICLVSLLM